MECGDIADLDAKIKNSCNAVRSHMIKKARERIGRLYKLHSFEEDNARLEHITGLLQSHTYLVRQCDRARDPEVRF